MRKITVQAQPGFECREWVDEETGKNEHAYYLDKKRMPGVTTICDVLDKPQLNMWRPKMATQFLLGKRDESNPEQWDQPPMWEAGVAYTPEQITELATKAGKWWKEQTSTAADYGTAAHDWIEGDLYGVKQAVPEIPQVLSSVTAWLEWKAQHHFEAVEVEWAICQRYWKVDPFTGEKTANGAVGAKLDVLALVDGILRVVDHKTGKGIWLSSILQVGKYHMMAEPLLSEPLAGRPIILHEPKDGRGFAAYELPVAPETCGQMFDTLYAAYKLKCEIEKKVKGMQPMSEPEVA